MPHKDFSHRSVVEKLGLKAGSKVRVVGKASAHLLSQVRAHIGGRLSEGGTPVDVILFYPKSFAEIIPTLNELKNQIVPSGGIWIITRKKGFAGYLKQDDLIPLGKQAGLVDNKICAVSEQESAMRFVIPRAARGR